MTVSTTGAQMSLGTGSSGSYGTAMLNDIGYARQGFLQKGY